MLTFAALVACLLVLLLVRMPLAGRAVLVVLVDILAVVFVLCPLLAHVTVAFGGSVGLIDQCAVLVVFVGCIVGAPLFDGVIACCTGNDTHVLMMVDYNVYVVLVD